MRKAAPLFVLLVALMALGGCIKMHSETVIEKDGSGVATLEVALSIKVADAMREMQEMDPNAGGEMDIPSFDEMDGDEIRKRIAPYDVKLTEFDKFENETHKGVKMAFAFKDLKGLSAALTAAMEGEDNQGMGIFDAGDGNLVLKEATYDFSDMPPPANKEEEEMAEPDVATETPSPEMQQKQMEMMGTLMGAMADLDIRLAITVPGDIVESNAPVVEGRTSIWTINAENMMSQSEDMNPIITFSGKGLKIKPMTE